VTFCRTTCCEILRRSKVEKAGHATNHILENTLEAVFFIDCIAFGKRICSKVVDAFIREAPSFDTDCVLTVTDPCRRSGIYVYIKGR
jgi:hypothetical protein